MNTELISIKDSHAGAMKLESSWEDIAFVSRKQEPVGAGGLGVLRKEAWW